MGLDNPLHIAFLLIVVLLVFGAKRLPEVGRSLGSGLRGFKDALSVEAPQQAVPTTQQQPVLTAAPAAEVAAAQQAEVTPLPALTQSPPPAA